MSVVGQRFGRHTFNTLRYFAGEDSRGERSLQELTLIIELPYLYSASRLSS